MLPSCAAAPRRRPITVSPNRVRNSASTTVLPTSSEVGGNDDLRHADLLRTVGEVGAAERQLLERDTAAEAPRRRRRRRTGRRAECRRPAAPSWRSAAAFPEELAAALDRDDVRAGRRPADRSSLDGLADQRRAAPSREPGARGRRACIPRSSRRGSARLDCFVARRRRTASDARSSM